MSKIAFIDLQAQRERIGPALDEAILRVVHHGKYIMGPEVAELEAALSGFCGAEQAISCSSGTDALLLPLMAWGVGPGDAVFVPSFTFAATAEVIALLGASPVFVDVASDTFNMDAGSLARAINIALAADLKPKAVIPVDLFGQPADYDAIIPVAREHDMKVLADGAQSFGAFFGGNKVGTIGDATATSFFPAKPLGCYGDGGAVFTDDKELADCMRSIRVHGKGSHKYDNERVGLNARMDTIQAAILIEKLKYFPDELVRRQAIADRYTAAFGAYLQTPFVDQRAVSAWAQYTILSDDRDGLAARLNEAGIPSVVYYPLPLNRQTAYKNELSTPTPVSDDLSDRVLSFPMHPYLETDTQDFIIDNVIANAELGA